MDDLISRQAAIDVVSGIDSEFVKYIEQLPSAQPEEPSYEAVKEYCRKRCLSIVDTALLEKYMQPEPVQQRIPCGERLPEPYKGEP